MDILKPHHHIFDTKKLLRYLNL